MNRIDLLIIHDLDLANLGSDALVAAHLDAACDRRHAGLEELKAAGLIKAIGAGVNRIGTIPRFLELPRPRFLPRRPALHARRAAGARCRVPALRDARRRRHHRRRRSPRASSPPGRCRARATTTMSRRRRRPSAIRPHGGGLRAPRRAARCRGAAVPPAPSDRRLGDPRRLRTRSTRPAMSRPCAYDIPDALWAALKHEGLLRGDAPTPGDRA